MTESEMEQLCVNVVRGLAMDAPQRASSGHPARRWRWHLWPTSCSRGCCVTTRAGPTGPIATGSSCPTVTRRSCCTRCCSSTATGSISRTSSSSASGVPRLPVTRRSIPLPASKLRPGRGQGFANGVGMAVAERFLRAHFGPEAIDHHVFVICATGLDGGREPRGRLARGPSRVGPSRVRFRPTPHHNRRPTDLACRTMS